MLKYDIIQFLNKNPELTYNGIEWNQNDESYESSRVDLYESLDEIIKCIDWLDRFYVPSSRRKDETNSYALKHYVEYYTGEYISNGAFVAAVMMRNLRYIKEKDNPNVFFKLHSKSLEEHRILYRERKRS